MFIFVTFPPSERTRRFESVVPVEDLLQHDAAHASLALQPLYHVCVKTTAAHGEEVLLFSELRMI